MRLGRKILATTAILAMLVALPHLPGASAQLAVGSGDHTIHILPPPTKQAALAADSGPLIYHGGPVMSGARAYIIFWVPATLQDGTPASLTAHYESVQQHLFMDYPGHALGSNTSQYYQQGTTTSYIPDMGGMAGSVVDTNPYPVGGCTDPYTGINCFTDAQLQSEIQTVMAAQGWTGGLNKMFLVFTPSGEGSCFDSTSGICAYNYYCAYHGSFVNGAGSNVVYGNQPYGNASYCQIPGVPSPNGDVAADTASTAASHELIEALTDPLLNAWYTAAGSEIGDLCAYIYGANSWDSGLANQMWNGRFYELQEEWDNHTGTCVQVGP